MNKEKIINNISFVIGVVTVIVMMILRNNIVLVGIVAGIGLFLYGVCAIINKNTYGYLFFSVGLSLFLTLLFYKYEVLNKGDSITFMVCMSTFLLMLITLIFMQFNKKKLYQLYNRKVDAKVIDLVKNPNTKKEFYQVIYEYELNGKVYSVGTPNYVSRSIPKIGDKLQLLVDSEDDADVYFEKSKLENIYNVLLCFIFMIVSLIIVITLFL